MSDTPYNDVPKPLIHLNGNSRENLLADYKAAYRAAKAAREAFARIDFHARDYYPLGPEAFPRAREARARHLDHLDSVILYLQDHVVSLLREGDSI